MEWIEWLEKTMTYRKTPDKSEMIYPEKGEEVWDSKQRKLVIEDKKPKRTNKLTSWEGWLEKTIRQKKITEYQDKTIPRTRREFDSDEGHGDPFDDDKSNSKEESLEELTDGKLEEIEKLKSWQVFLKAFGGTESKVPKVKNPEKVEEGGFTAADLENPPKRVKGKFPNWVKETGKIESSGNEKTSLEGDVQYSGGLKRGNLDPKHVEESAKLAFQTQFGNSGTASSHLGGTERVPPKKLQAELDEEFFKKSWEGWLTKYTETEEDKKLSVELSEARAVNTGKIPKRRTKPEEGVDAKKDEISQINAFKWASWLEKMQGAGDARFGNQHLTGLEQEPIRGESMEITPEKEEKDDKKEREDEKTDEKEDNKPYKALGGEED